MDCAMAAFAVSTCGCQMPCSRAAPTQPINNPIDPHFHLVSAVLSGPPEAQVEPNESLQPQTSPHPHGIAATCLLAAPMGSRQPMGSPQSVLVATRWIVTAHGIAQPVRSPQLMGSPQPMAHDVASEDRRNAWDNRNPLDRRNSWGHAIP